jgi:hypothetical protein
MDLSVSEGNAASVSIFNYSVCLLVESIANLGYGPPWDLQRTLHALYVKSRMSKRTHPDNLGSHSESHIYTGACATIMGFRFRTFILILKPTGTKESQKSCGHVLRGHSSHLCLSWEKRRISSVQSVRIPAWRRTSASQRRTDD